MIEEKFVGTHDDQRREGLIRALHEAGIGKAYADRTLDDAGKLGSDLKNWMIEHRDRLKGEGYGFDFRGTGTTAVNLVNLASRGMIFMGIYVRVVPLIKLPRMLAAEEGEAELRAIHHLVIRDFETDRENPLRAYETAQIEALIEDRLGNQTSVSVVRRGRPAGWWSATTEDLIEQNARVIEIA